MTLSEYICGIDAVSLQENEVLRETTRRSQELRTRQSLLAVALVSVVGAGFIWSLWNRADNWGLVIWVLAIIVLTARRSVIKKRIRNDLSNADPQMLVRNETDLVVTGIGIPAIVGAGYWLFCTPGNNVTILGISLLCCMYAIGTTAYIVAQRRMQSLMVILNLGQGVLFFATRGSVEYYTGAIQVFALLLLLLAFAKRSHEMFVDLVRSELELKQQSERLLHSRVKIEAALEEAVEANKKKSQFLAAASHDLSQPMHAMSIFIGNLKQTVTENPKQHELIEKIENTSDILKQQFGGLLDMSRYDAGGVTVQKQLFDLYALCELVVQSEYLSAQQRDVDLKFTGKHIQVNSDPVLLGRLVYNLVVNAIKFTDEGAVELKLEQNDNRVLLTVTDSGCGFSEADKERIFDDFVQLNNSERNRNKGVGLGLSIVRRISKLLGVDVTVKSTPGVGSEFLLSLPRVDTAVTSLQQESSSRVTQQIIKSAKTPQDGYIDLNGVTVLLVDDDPNILDALGDYIEGRGGRALLAATPRQAINYADSNDINFAIIDDMLGSSTSGFELAIRVAKDLASNRIIIVTGNIRSKRMQKLKSSDFGVYSKPLSVSRLDAIIGKRLGLNDLKMSFA